jgi:hypothetical protein
VPRIEIPRLKRPDPQWFADAHVAGEGLPAIVSGDGNAWPALGKWSFAFFADRYGDDFVTTTLGLVSEHGKTTRFGEYISYLDRPEQPLPGFWVMTRFCKPMREPPPIENELHYLLDWNAFQRHPELRADVEPPLPFIADWESSLSPRVRQVFETAFRREYSSIYIGPAGTHSPLHQDFGDTHSVLTQIEGRKRVTLLPPSASANARETARDLTDARDLPGSDESVVYVGVFGPGESLYIPPNWWHAVDSLDKSITVSHNFFNQSNFDGHFAAFLGKLPRLVEALANSPELRESLGIAWAELAHASSVPAGPASAHE